MTDPNTAADAAAPAPLVPAPIAADPATPPAAPGPLIDFAPDAPPGVAAGVAVAIEPGAEAPADDPTPPTGRMLSPLQMLRNALKARITGIRGHLVHAEWGDHRATAAALRMLTDLVADMLGPDTPEDSLRGALSDLVAGRTTDAEKSLGAALAVLRAGDTGIETHRVDALAGTIEAAQATLQVGDRADAQRLIEAALAIIQPPGV